MPDAIQISKNVMMRDLEGESVLLDLDSQHYYGLGEVGTRMWQLLEKHGEPRAVVDDLLEEFDVERPRLERDLETFLAELEAAGLVTVERPGEGEDAASPQAP